MIIDRSFVTTYVPIVGDLCLITPLFLLVFCWGDVVGRRKEVLPHRASAPRAIPGMDNFRLMCACLVCACNFTNVVCVGPPCRRKDSVAVAYADGGHCHSEYLQGASFPVPSLYLNARQQWTRTIGMM